MGKPPERIATAVHLFGTAHPDAFFIQIGAHDGRALDPLRDQIRRRRWRGIMVEPVPYVFERLAERYSSHPRVSLELAAIADHEGTMPFYHLREARPDEEVWRWYDALGSFKREVVLGHRALIPDIDTRLVEAEVSTLTFTKLCERHGVSQIDLLQIDTEGYDYEILRSIDLKRWRPRLLLYEHCHLSEDDRASAREILDTSGYRCFEDGLDTAALDMTRLGHADRRLVRLFGSA